jgi:hypothetical protein
LSQHEGYGTFDDVEDDIRRRFGDHEADRFLGVMSAHCERERRQMAFVAGVNYNAEPALKVIPAPLFLDVLEDAVGLVSYSHYAAVTEINRLFSKRGIYYRFTPAGQAEWHGDEGAHESILRPALDVLSDLRLGGARSEFEAAMHHLRAGSAKDEEDAIEEAAKSVESTMKVLLQQHGVALTGKETAFPLFELLTKNRIAVAEGDQAVTAAARLRNAYGGHGAGAVARHLPPDVAALAVRCAATAIVYLASRLP